MRRWAAAGLLLGLAVAAALWFGPRLLDEALLRDRLAALASERLGRPVALTGPIGLQLLPAPRLEAADITIGAPGDALAATAHGLRLTLDVGALLAGRLSPRELVIVGAELRLPWPPAALQDLRPPPWLSAAFEARLEDSRVVLGTLQLEQLEMTLASPDSTAALSASGRFAWRGRPVRFSGKLGRAGGDGAAPLDLTLAAATGQVSANGILDLDGGFEGEVAAVGSDLAAFLPAPAGAFELRGRLTADAELVALDPLSLRLEGQTARGAASLRLAPEPRLDLALNAGSLDLDGWVGALRQGNRPPLPVRLDLAAEAARLGGLPLRRLRGGLEFVADRLAITDATVLLPGDTRVEVSGASAGPRLDLAVAATSGDFRGLLSALGAVPPVDPALLRRADGRFRLALEGGEAAVTELDAQIDAMRLRGGGTWRTAPRPLLGLGLTVDRLALDGLLADRLALAPLAQAGFDLSLRLAADQAVLRGVAVDRAALDAGLEAGRLSLRRLGFRLGEIDVAVAGIAELGADPPRLSELTVEASGRGGPALVALLPAAVRPALGATEPVLLRASGGGVPEAIALRLEAEAGALRLEATGTVDAMARRAAGTLTLRHPGAPRLLAPWLGADAVDWLGEGSLAVIAALSGGAALVVAEHLDLVAGELRGQGRMALALDGARPSLLGRFAAERLRLPPLPSDAAGAAQVRALPELDAELALTADRLTVSGLPTLSEAAADVRLMNGGLTVKGLRARVAGGTLAAELEAVPAAAGLAVALRGALVDLALTERLTGLPFDLTAGRVGGEVALRATGGSVAALLATLTGDARLTARDGVLAGLDLPAALAAAGRPGLEAAATGLRAALGGGATGFERFALRAAIAAGRAALGGEIELAEGAAASTEGVADLPRRTLDLRVALVPEPAAPAVAVRALGPWASPRLLPELAAYLRWRAERE